VGIHQRSRQTTFGASIRRAVRSGLYAADDPSFSQLVEDMDDNLFTSIRHNPHHVLYKLLPDKTDHKLFDHVYDCILSIGFYYRAMHFSAKRGIAIACRLSVCDVGGM